MTPEEQKTMLLIGKRLGEIEKKLKVIEDKSAIPAMNPAAITKPLVASDAANKFFGASPAPKGPHIKGNMVVKDEVDLMNAEYQKELQEGQEMFSKAIKEFCIGMNIKEFNITFTDDSPKKD